MQELRPVQSSKLGSHRSPCPKPPCSLHSPELSRAGNKNYAEGGAGDGAAGSRSWGQRGERCS